MDGLRPIPGVLVTAQNHNRTKTQGLLAAALLPGPRRPVGESAARRRHRRRRHPPPAKTRPQVIQQATCKQHKPRQTAQTQASARFSAAKPQLTDQCGWHQLFQTKTNSWIDLNRPKRKSQLHTKTSFGSKT